MSKLPIRHRPPTSDTEHERDFWAWKYERREAECEELASRLGDLLIACKGWRQDQEAEAGQFPDRAASDADKVLFDAIEKAEQVGGSSD